MVLVKVDPNPKGAGMLEVLKGVTSLGQVRIQLCVAVVEGGLAGRNAANHVKCSLVPHQMVLVKVDPSPKGAGMLEVSSLGQVAMQIAITYAGSTPSSGRISQKSWSSRRLTTTGWWTYTLLSTRTLGVAQEAGGSLGVVGDSCG